MQKLRADSIECEVSDKSFYLTLVMSIKPVPDPLAKFLGLYCNVEVLEWTHRLSELLRSRQIPDEEAALFREQFIEAIEGKILTPEQFKAVTGDNEYTTSAALRDRLRELWSEIFPDESIPA